MLRTPPQRYCRRGYEVICHLSFARSFLLESAYLERRVVRILYINTFITHTHNIIILLYYYIYITLFARHANETTSERVTRIIRYTLLLCRHRSAVIILYASHSF